MSSQAKSLAGFLPRIIKSGMGFHSPFQLNFAVTYRCPTKCRICHIWKHTGEDELSPDEIKKISSGLKNIYWLRLTGGEPFLRPDFPEIVKIFHDALPDLYLVSTPTGGFNPELIESEVEKILSFVRARFVVTVSLDGPSECHDELRNKKGSYSGAVETFRLLRSMENNHRNFRVLFGYTIQPGNLFQFEKTLEEVKQQFPGITVNDFHINIAQKSEIFYDNLNVDFGGKFSDDTAKEIKSILKTRPFSLSPYSLIENIYLKLALKYLRTGRSPLRCNVHNTSLFINPSGDVYPCTGFNRRLGNLREAEYNIDAVMNSDRARSAAREIKEGKCPRCWTPCEAHQVIVSKFLTALVKAV